MLLYAPPVQICEGVIFDMCNVPVKKRHFYNSFD